MQKHIERRVWEPLKKCKKKYWKESFRAFEGRPTTHFSKSCKTVIKKYSKIQIFKNDCFIYSFILIWKNINKKKGVHWAELSYFLASLERKKNKLVKMYSLNISKFHNILLYNSKQVQSSSKSSLPLLIQKTKTLSNCVPQLSKLEWFSLFFEPALIRLLHMQWRNTH